MKTNQFTYKSKSVCYADEGEGSVIVFLHGFLESMEIWDDFVSTLSKKFRVIAIDLPGHGKTDDFEKAHSMDLMAEVVKSVLDQLKVEKCVLVGHSMGGYVTMAFASHYPEYLKGIVLFHSHAAADKDEARQNRTRTINLVKHDKTGFITSFIPGLFSPTHFQKFNIEIKRLKRIAGNSSKESIVAALEGMKNRVDNRIILENIEIPVMIIAGKEDSKIPLGAISAQAMLPRHCELIMLAGVGHMGFFEAPDITQGLIESFALRNLL